MRTKIKYDIYDIERRLKELDNRYFLMWNALRSKYEIHFEGGNNTLLLTLPYDSLDKRAIDYLNKSSIHNVDLDNIDRKNEYIERRVNEDNKYENSYKLREMIAFGNKICDDYDFGSHDTHWI